MIVSKKTIELRARRAAINAALDKAYKDLKDLEDAKDALYLGHPPKGKVSREEKAQVLRNAMRETFNICRDLRMDLSNANEMVANSEREDELDATPVLMPPVTG